MIKHYSQGITSEGPVILKDGQPMAPEEIVKDLNDMTKALALVKVTWEARGFGLPKTHKVITKALM